MASRKGTLTYTLVLDTKAFESSARRVAKTVATGFGIGGGIALFQTFSRGLQDATRAVIASNVEFERLTTQIKTLTVGGSEDIERLNRSLVSMVSATAKGPQELARALFFVESSGIRGAAAMETTAAAAAAASVGLGDSATVARTVVAAMNAYSGSHLTATQSVDKLIEIVKQGGAEASEYAGTLGRVLSVAASLGVTFDEVGGFMAVFTRQGVSADEAATSLRGAILAIGTPTEGAAKAFAEVGLSTERLKTSLRRDGLAATLDLITKAFDGDIDAMKRAIPNIRALAGVLAVSGDQAGAYREAVDAIAMSTGNLADVTVETAGTMSFQWDRLTALLEARVTASDSFIGDFTTTWLTAAGDWVEAADLWSVASLGFFGGLGVNFDTSTREAKEWSSSMIAAFDEVATEQLRSLSQQGRARGAPSGTPLPVFAGGGGPEAPELGLPSADEMATMLGKGLTAELARATKENEKAAKIVEKAWEKSLEAVEKQATATAQALDERLVDSWNAYITELEGAEQAQIDLSMAQDDGIANLAALDRLEAAHTEGVMETEGATLDAAAATVEWSDALADAANQMIALGGSAADLGKIMGGIAGIGAGLDLFKEGRAQGGLGGFFGQVAGVAGIAGAAIGIGSAIVGLFKSDPVEDAAREAGNTLGFEISNEMAEAFAEQAEATGQSIAEIAEEWFDEVRQQLRAEGMALALTGIEAQAAALGGAPQFAEIAARNFNTVFWEFVKDNGLPAALDAFGSIFEQIRAAFGDEVPPGFERLERLFNLMQNPEISAALQFAQGQADVVSGATRAGFFDPTMTQDSVAIAEATLEMLREQGVDDKTSNQLISGLLQAELNAAIASGNEIDADLQALLDQAEASGVQVLPDIAHQQLDVLKRIYRELSGNNYSPPGSGVPSFAQGVLDRDFGSGTLAMLHGRESVIPSGSGGGFGSLGDLIRSGIGGLSAALSEADIERVARRAAENVSAERPINVATNVSISEDPLTTHERREEMRRFNLEVTTDALRRRDAALMLELRRALVS